MRFSPFCILFILYTLTFKATAQINTAVPFLTISPDARSGAMGDAGAAISADANALYWNPSKIAFLENESLSLSYSPWLKGIAPNMFLSYGSFIHRLDERNAIGVSFRYFSLGTVNFYDESQNAQGTSHPYEFSVDGTFARSFGENFSMGLSLRYLYSLLTNTIINQGQYSAGGKALAADASFYFKHPTIQFGKEALFAVGVNISNLGARISYSTDGRKYFLPTNLKIGVANTWFLDDYSAVTVAFDINKLLVPTPPIRDANNVIIAGKDDNKTVVEGIFSSFSDAPGGLGEELKELSFSPGIEYSYNKRFSVRTGYFYENPDKGNRHYLTAGLGLIYKEFNFDFCSLFASQEKSPLANTLRFSVAYKFANKK